MSRPAVAKGFIPELDGLRGIAITMVMVHRFWPRTANGTAADVAGAGWIGVDLFFVISGFLIAGILLDTRGEPGFFKNFYARRMLRIFPLFYLFVAGVWIALGRNPEFREHAGSPLWYFLHLGNVPEGVLGLDVPYWLAPLWSLAIEEQFYLTFPLLVWLLDRRRLAIALVAMIAFAPLIRLATTLAFPDHERVQYLVTACRIDTLAVGCLLAVIVRAVDLERWRSVLQSLCWAVLPVVVALGVASGLDRTSPFDRVLGYSLVAVGCASVLALVILSRGQRSTAMLRVAPLRYLGKLCFGLYLLHRPADTIVSALAARAGFAHDLWLLPVKVGVALGLATVSWRLLEQPFLALKARYRSQRHPSATAAAAPPRLARLLRTIGLWSLVSCSGTIAPSAPPDVRVDAPADSPVRDAADVDQPLAVDAAEPPPPVVLYPEGARHSPITPSIASTLQAIAAHQPRVFAKVGDSITVAADFLHCFDGGAVDLGTHDELAPTISYFLAGNAANSSPFDRDSYCAEGGTTAADALDGTFAHEVTTIDPQLAVIMFGTNELRLGWSYDKAGRLLWQLVDDAIARGIVPILSTIPPNNEDPSVDAKIPTYNRIIRALAQGRGIPLIDLHRELLPLANRGISDDRIHPSTAPGGGCILTSAGLAYGYNVRNLLTVEALARTHAAVTGTAADASAPVRTGAGTATDPFHATLPLVDLADTRRGEPSTCGAGNQIVYELDLPAATSLRAWVVGDAAVHLGTCTGGSSAVLGPGLARVVVEGNAESLLVVEAR